MTEEGRNSCNQNYGRILGEYNNGSLIYVAVQGAIGDWAAYWGKAELGEDKIRSNGSKMHPAYAFELFPWLNPEKWRA